MFRYFVIKIIILCQIQIIHSLFVSVGDYSNEQIPGLNSPECGLNVEPIVYELSLNNPCFQRKYEDKTLVFFDIQKGRYDPQTSGRVYKGVDVKHPYESPWVVHFKWFKKNTVCTGVLITPYWVMTAAHCFEKMGDNWSAGVLLNMGSNKKRGTHVSHVLPGSWYVHPMYTNQSISDSKRFKSDIALIRVGGFIPETTPDDKYFINTICLPKRWQINYHKENCTFYGYGKLHDNERDNLPEYLQMGWVELSPYTDCGGMICGRFTGENFAEKPRPCPGDSGGPLVQYMPGIASRAVLVGTLRGGVSPTCSNKLSQAYWVQTSDHIDWILKTMKENFS